MIDFSEIINLYFTLFDRFVISLFPMIQFSIYKDLIHCFIVIFFFILILVFSINDTMKTMFSADDDLE